VNHFCCAILLARQSQLFRERVLKISKEPFSCQLLLEKNVLRNPKRKPQEERGLT
jgi:hypothetical protein